MKQISIITVYLFLLSIGIGCKKDAAYLTIDYIDFTESYRNEFLDLPNGVYIPDNPNFDIDNPETWTGNMAEYVKRIYVYSVSYKITNTGENIAYNTEIDIYYSYDSGDEIVETKYIGNINPNESVTRTITIFCTNRQLLESSCEVFWYN
jgi:hypothetical protein